MENKNEGNKTRKEDRKEELKAIVARVKEKAEDDFLEQERKRELKTREVIDLVYSEILENVVYNIYYDRARGFTDGNINIVLYQSVIDKFEIDEGEVEHYERLIGLKIVMELEEIFNDVEISYQESFGYIFNRHDCRVYWNVK